MRQLTIGRRLYWIFVALLLALKICIVVVIEVAPQSFEVLRHIDTAIVITLALVVGARFADIRWPRWLGIVLVLVIAVVLPIALVLASPKLPINTASRLDLVPDLAWISTVLLAILLVVTGVKRGSSIPEDGNSESGQSHDGRKEPTFP